MDELHELLGKIDAAQQHASKARTQDEYTAAGEKAIRLLPAIIAKLRSVEPAGREWLPIDSAPHDGGHILGYSPDSEYGIRETYMGRYRPGSIGYDHWKRGIGYETIGWQWYEPFAGAEYTWKPTHWMPLPAPPTDRRTPENE